MRCDWLVAVLGYTCLVSANVEKTVFVTPNAWVTDHSLLASLHIESLSPANNSLRQALSRSVPQSAGLATWYSLGPLSPAQRHEVRVCWAATVSALQHLVHSLSVVSFLCAHDFRDLLVTQGEATDKVRHRHLYNT